MVSYCCCGEKLDWPRDDLGIQVVAGRSKLARRACCNSYLHLLASALPARHMAARGGRGSQGKLSGSQAWLTHLP